MTSLGISKRRSGKNINPCPYFPWPEKADSIAFGKKRAGLRRSRFTGWSGTERNSEEAGRTKANTARFASRPKIMLGEDTVNKKLIICVLPFIVCLQLCTKRPEEPTHLVEFIKGVKVIKNLKTELDKAFNDLELIEDLSIGVEEGDENFMFSYPVDVDSDSNGHIYVLDYQECLMTKYDSKGMFMTKFGRKGQGPGEFSNPSSMMIT